MSNEFGVRYRGRSDKGVDLMRIFAAAFTLSCLLLFAAPVVKCIDLAFSIEVTFWLGLVPRVFVFFPLGFILVAHIIHWRRQAPNKYAILLATVGSALVLLVLSHRLLGQAASLSAKFSSTDCSFPQKHELELAHQAAKSFFESCQAQSENADYNYMITDCRGYQEQLATHPSWNYLEKLEQRYACAGWCTTDKPLWGFAFTTRAPCSGIVGQILQTSVSQVAKQVFIYCIFIVMGSATSLILLGPKIRDLGMDW